MYHFSRLQILGKIAKPPLPISPTISQDFIGSEKLQKLRKYQETIIHKRQLKHTKILEFNIGFLL